MLQSISVFLFHLSSSKELRAVYTVLHLQQSCGVGWVKRERKSGPRSYCAIYGQVGTQMPNTLTATPAGSFWESSFIVSSNNRQSSSSTPKLALACLLLMSDMFTHYAAADLFCL